MVINIILDFQTSISGGFLFFQKKTVTIIILPLPTV